MAHERQAAFWAPAARIMAILWANYRGKFPKGKQPKALRERDLNPFAPPEPKLPPIPLKMLKAIFVRPKQASPLKPSPPRRARKRASQP